MHPLTAARWDMKSKSESDLELKRFGYQRGLPRIKGGQNAQSRFADIVPPQWLAFQGNFEPPTKPKAQVSPRMKSSKAERKVDLQTMDHIRVLHYEDSRRKGRLVVQRWRNGHADLTVPNCETQGPREGCPGGQWQEGLRNTVCDNLLTFSGVYN
ncbi:nipblb [Symbiodinium necroappetens]|uniref:Nipblb protein n=1 Tax=Symbiodinium necroappetens TaxID=1628268 RepID=A0A812W8N4_9DINO|nr:nipblb [Symbiodinium necroappetens]